MSAAPPPPPPSSPQAAGPPNFQAAGRAPQPVPAAPAPPAPPAFAPTVPIALTASAVSAAPATSTVSAAPVGRAAPPPSARSYAAPGAYGQPPAPLATPHRGTPRRTRRRRRGAPRPLVITVVVLVVVLVLGTATVVGLRLLRKDSATGAGTTTVVLPSNDWAHGARKAWTLDIGGFASVSTTGVAGNNDQLVVSNLNPHSNHAAEIKVTAYDVSGDEPQEQWSTDLDCRKTQTDPFHYYVPFYWGDYLIVDDKLLRADNGEVSDAPWDRFPNMRINPVRGDYVIACDEEDHCSAWNAEDPDRKLWETDIPDSFEYAHNYADGIFRGVYEGDKTIAFASPGVAVDLDTGDLYDFHIDYSIDYSEGKEGRIKTDESILVLADGWSKYDESSDQITILSPTGEELETLDGGPLHDAGVYLTSDHPRPTAAELKSYIEDGDADWAQIRGEYDKNSNTDCSTTLTINDSTFKPTDERERCIGLPPYPQIGPTFSLSSDGSILMLSLFENAMGPSTGRQISGMWNVENGEIIDFPGNEFSGDYTAFYLVNPELIVAYEIGGGSNASNELTAYRPDKK